MKALVIGAGIAGPAAAIALRQAGIDAAVFEARAPRTPEWGAFMTVMPNGITALQELGVHAAVQRVGFPAGGLDLVNEHGETVGQRRFDTDTLAPLTLTRAGLASTLRVEATRCGVRVEQGKRLADIHTHTDGVTAAFADGSTETGDLLIGADGVWSRTRTLIDPDAPAPRYTGVNIVFGFDADITHPVPPGRLRAITGRTAFFGYKTAPDGATWWFARLPRGESCRAELAEPAEVWKQRVLEHVAGDDTSAAEVVHATGTTVVAVNGYDIARTPVWHTDRSVLIGDAVHAGDPAAGQGASLALEDALTLGQCVRGVSASTMQAAFRAFERSRRERVEQHVAHSAGRAQQH